MKDNRSFSCGLKKKNKTLAKKKKKHSKESDGQPLVLRKNKQKQKDVKYFLVAQNKTNTKNKMIENVLLETKKKKKLTKDKRWPIFAYMNQIKTNTNKMKDNLCL